MTVSQPHSQFPWLKRRYEAVAGPWNDIGVQTKFYGRTLRSIVYAVTNYRVELLRIIAQMGLGAGALIMIGGTVAIVGFLTVTTGALVAVQGYTDFSEIGVEALTGFASAFFNVRLIAPATTAVALSATRPTCTPRSLTLALVSITRPARSEVSVTGTVDVRVPVNNA